MTASSTTVFVTSNGEADGVGVGLIRRFAAEGARIVVAGHDLAHGRALVEDITATGGNASFVLTDLDDLVSVGRAVDQAGSIDVLVNVADDFAPSHGSASGRGMDDWYTKTFTSLLLTCAVVPGMRRRGRGVVVTINTVGRARSTADPASDQQTKLRELTGRWAHAWAAPGVRVNSIAVEIESAATHGRGHRTRLVETAMHLSREHSTITGTTVGMPGVPPG